MMRSWPRRLVVLAVVLVVVRTIVSSRDRAGPRPRHPRASRTDADRVGRLGDTVTTKPSLAPVPSSASRPPPPPPPPPSSSSSPPPPPQQQQQQQQQQPPPALPSPHRPLFVDVPDEVAIHDMGLHEVEPFIATYEWQEIKEGQSIPAGLYVKVDLQTGKKMAKLLRDRPGIMLPSEIRAAAAAAATAGGAHAVQNPMSHHRKSGAELRRARLEREHRERAL